MFKSITEKDVAFLAKILPNSTFTNNEQLIKYSHDETEDISILPNVVLKPETVEEISAILKYCNEHTIPVTPSGARTGLSGGAIPLHGGVALSMEKTSYI